MVEANRDRGGGVRGVLRGAADPLLCVRTGVETWLPHRTLLVRGAVHARLLSGAGTRAYPESMRMPKIATSAHGTISTTTAVDDSSSMSSRLLLSVAVTRWMPGASPSVSMLRETVAEAPPVMLV